MAGVNEDNEEFPGNYILYNKDDDDDDGVPDYEDGYNKNGIAGDEDDDNIYENDLVAITLGCVEPYYYMTGQVTFDVTSGASKVKVWESSTKGTQVSLPATFNTPVDLSKTFYVEGIEPSGGPRDVEFKLTYTKAGRIFEDKIKVTVVHVELFRDCAYTQPLDDWPKSGNLLRSPKYIFGEEDPIYVQVKNIGTDPDLAEPITAAVVVKSQSSYFIYMDLKETGVDTQLFRNSDADTGELLYLSTEDSDDYPDPTTRDTIRLIDEEVLYFWLRVPPIYGAYKRSEDAMVDRAEIGVEWQVKYEDYAWGYDNIPSWGFSRELYQKISTDCNTTWFQNFENYELDSKELHWRHDNDSGYADSVDIAVWTGHGTYNETYEMCAMSFFKNNIPLLPESVDELLWYEVDWGDKDADWIIIHNCWFLYGTDEQLKQLVSSVPGVRCAHLICGFVSKSFIGSGTGNYFSEQLGQMSIKQAWFKYCQETQPSGFGVTAKVFGAEECMDDSLAWPPGPIKVSSRDPTLLGSIWKSETFTKP